MKPGDYGKNAEHLAAYSRAYRAKHRERLQAQAKARYANRTEEKRQAVRDKQRLRYQQDPAYREKILAQGRQWDDTHRGEVRIAKREQVAKYRAENREAYLAYRRAHYQKTYPTRKLIELNAHLKRKYGISLQDYNMRLADQGGVCAVCGLTSTNGTRLHVDHNHTTGKVRGLLCSPCNLLVVKVIENYYDRLEPALRYLSRTNA